MAENRIRELRLMNGWSQKKLGGIVGTSAGKICELETGAANLTLTWMRRIAAALGVATVEVLSDADRTERLNMNDQKLLDIFRSALPQDRETLLRIAGVFTGDDHANND